MVERRILFSTSPMARRDAVRDAASTCRASSHALGRSGFTWLLHAARHHWHCVRYVYSGTIGRAPQGLHPRSSVSIRPLAWGRGLLQWWRLGRSARRVTAPKRSLALHYDTYPVIAH